MEKLEKCELCPHRCGINRKKGQIGWCKSKDTVKIAKISVHDYEEPCISGNNGSGTIFFSNCTMKCVFCQNYEISQEGKGKPEGMSRTVPRGRRVSLSHILFRMFPKRLKVAMWLKEVETA